MNYVSTAIGLFLLCLGLTSVFGDKFLVIHSPFAGSHPWHVLPVTRESDEDQAALEALNAKAGEIVVIGQDEKNVGSTDGLLKNVMSMEL